MGNVWTVQIVNRNMAVPGVDNIESVIWAIVDVELKEG